MQFLRTAFWVILAVAIALFCKANNRPMTIKIWGDIVWETRIWFPMLISFLLGALPFWIVARATRWRLKRRLESTERALVAAATTAAPAVPATPIAEETPAPSPAPSITGPA
ncbi:MAG: lipopolysaccharide assembly protein LapA domain-containing protein [Sphingobium sp.]